MNEFVYIRRVSLDLPGNNMLAFYIKHLVPGTYMIPFFLIEKFFSEIG